MEQKELNRLDEAVKYLKEWLHFLEECGWETVELDSFFGRKLYECLKLLIKFVEEKKG